MYVHILRVHFQIAITTQDTSSAQIMFCFLFKPGLDIYLFRYQPTQVNAIVMSQSAKGKTRNIPKKCLKSNRLGLVETFQCKKRVHLMYVCVCVSVCPE